MSFRRDVQVQEAAAFGGYMSQESRRVLIVDDSDSDRNSLREALEKRGHRVTAVASGAAALGAIEAQEPDLLITDLHMPGMDGFQLVVNVRKVGGNFPVLMITTESSIELAEAGKRL